MKSGRQTATKLDVECSLLGLDNISIDDYNFDGIEDLSIFGSQPCRSKYFQIYYLYNKTTQQYYESNFKWNLF